MKNFITITATVVIFGSGLVLFEQRRQHWDGNHPDSGFERMQFGGGHKATASAKAPIGDIVGVVRAAGKIEGRTEMIELRARVSEQIQRVHVVEGQWVSQGELLVSLDASRLEAERDLASAVLAEAEARKMRLENGARDSEIAAAREEYAAATARLEGAEKAYLRGERLLLGNALSRQDLDDLQANFEAHKALAEAAKKRLETIEAPARSDELLAAWAQVRAAESRLRIAQVNLDRAAIKAPIDGQILSLDGEVGELTGPDSIQPLVIISDTSRLRVVAEIDEYDALRIRVGYPAEVTCDGTEGILGYGKIVEIEPQMDRKRLFGQWAGERSDAFARRVKIEIDGKLDLPIGLPVDVSIQLIQEHES